MKKPQMVEEKIEIFQYSFYGTVEECKQKIEEAFNKVPVEYRSSVVVEIASEHDYEDSTKLVSYIKYKRPETDKDRAARAKEEEARLKWRRNQYELLKREFEK